MDSRSLMLAVVFWWAVVWIVTAVNGAIHTPHERPMLFKEFALECSPNPLCYDQECYIRLVKYIKELNNTIDRYEGEFVPK